MWALADFGIRVVIAPRFGEIFFSNCFRNGLLPIVLGEAEHGAVMRAAEAGEKVSVDLEAQRIVLADGAAIGFAIDSYRRRALLLGLDEIGAILADDAAEIAAFEARQKAETPWLHLSREQLSHFDDLRTSEA